MGKNKVTAIKSVSPNLGENSLIVTVYYKIGNAFLGLEKEAWPHLFCTLPIDVRDEARNGDPEEEADQDDSADNVVAEKLEDRVDVEVVDKVPDSLHHILHGTLATTLHRMKDRNNSMQY